MFGVERRCQLLICQPRGGGLAYRLFLLTLSTLACSLRCGTGILLVNYSLPDLGNLLAPCRVVLLLRRGIREGLVESRSEIQEILLLVLMLVPILVSSRIVKPAIRLVGSGLTQ